MTTFDWTTAIAECCAHLAGLGNLPPPATPDPALDAIAVLSLIADTPIQHALMPDSTIPLLTVPRYPGRHDLLGELLAELTDAVAAPARGNFHNSFSPTNWCSSSIEMTPLCKVDLALPEVWGALGVGGAGGVDEQEGIRPARGVIGRSVWPFACGGRLRVTRCGAAPGLSVTGRFETRRRGELGLDAARAAEQ